MNGWIIDHTKADLTFSSSSPTPAYRFGEEILHHRRVQPNDVVFLRNEKRLIRISRIRDVSTSQGDFQRARCPTCGTTQIVLRQTQSLPYRCVHGHGFTDPVAERYVASTRIATFESDYTTVKATIETAEMRAFELTNSPTLMLRPCDLNGLAQYISRRDRNAKKFLALCLKGRPLDITDLDGDDSDIADVLDERRLGILLRRGRKILRDGLIRVYGPRCMISGCTVTGLLEAAPIPPRSLANFNSPTNGLLLRSDLHTLFDLNLIGIDPDNLSIALHPSLARTEYGLFKGSRLLVSAGDGPNRRALLARWESYVAHLHNADHLIYPDKSHAREQQMKKRSMHDSANDVGDTHMI